MSCTPVNRDCARSGLNEPNDLNDPERLERFALMGDVLYKRSDYVNTQGMKLQFDNQLPWWYGKPRRTVNYNTPKLSYGCIPSERFALTLLLFN